MLARPDYSFLAACLSMLGINNHLEPETQRAEFINVCANTMLFDAPLAEEDDIFYRYRFTVANKAGTAFCAQITVCATMRALPKYLPEKDTRLTLKSCHRQYEQYTKLKTMLQNNLILLLDLSSPGVNSLFGSLPKALESGSNSLPLYGIMSASAASR